LALVADTLVNDTKLSQGDVIKVFVGAHSIVEVEELLSKVLVLGGASVCSNLGAQGSIKT